MFMQNLPSKGGGKALSLPLKQLRKRKGTFRNAHSFWAASLDMYIQEADLRFPR